MSSETIPTKIFDGVKYISFNDLHNLFVQSNYGRIMIAKIRYERYKPWNLDAKEWEKLLGPDVNNLKHLWVVYKLARNFINDQIYAPKEFKNRTKGEFFSYNQAETESILLASLIHDWGEAEIGDITFEKKDKNKNLKQDEIVALRKIAANLINDGSEGILLDKINEVIDRVILKSSSSRIGRAFNAVERQGYLLNGVKAWNLSKSKSMEFELSDKLKWLSNNVFLNQIPALVEYSKIYYPIYKTLLDKRSQITEIFMEMPDDNFKNYNIDELDQKIEQFKKAQRAWFSSKIVTVSNDE
ncbi:MAG: hypothetical protein GF335_01335 [Candidatus Moranbacteria bacterium]|nr:hypothetical protein [Candidatus Moranbacteria bacterium]